MAGDILKWSSVCLYQHLHAACSCEGLQMVTITLYYEQRGLTVTSVAGDGSDVLTELEVLQQLINCNVIK